MGVTNPILSHRKCPCCFDCGECIGSFVIDTNCTIPAIDGSWTTCKTNALASWATLSETPKGLNGDQWVYATDYVTNSALLGGGGCSWQAAQYCVDNPAGHRGRAWVVDLWLHDDVAGTTVRYSSGQVTDWVCTCNGPRFSWSLSSVTDLGCFGRTGTGCKNCTGKCLRITLPALASNPFSPDCGPQPTVETTADVTFGSTAIVSAAGAAPDVTTWTIETVCSSTDAQITLTYDCPTKNPTAITAVYRRSGDCFGSYTRVSGDTTYLPATLAVTDCCNPTTGPTLCPDGCPECYTVAYSGFAGTDGVNANGTIILRRSPCSSTCWTYNDGTYTWAIEKLAFNWRIVFGRYNAFSSCLYDERWWEASIAPVPPDCNVSIVFTGGGINPIGASHISSAPTSLTAVPGGC